MYRDIRGLCIGAGTVEVQRNFIGAQGAARPVDRAPRLERERNLSLSPTPCSHPDRDPPAPTLDVPPAGCAPRDRPSLDELLTTAAPDASPTAWRALGGRAAGAGVRRGDAVAWQPPNRKEVALLYRACWRLGAIAAPIHHLAGAADVERMLGHGSTRASSSTAGRACRAGRARSTPVRAERAAPERRRRVVLFTSGSTGAPKGVAAHARALAYKAALMAAVHGSAPTTPCSCPRRWRTSPGCSTACSSPGVGRMRTVFMARWDPEHALDLIERERVTFMIGPPTFFVVLMAAPGFSPSGSRRCASISSGGAGVTPRSSTEAIDAFGASGQTHVRIDGGADGHDAARRRRPVERAARHRRPTGRRGRAADRTRRRAALRGPELFVGYIDAEQKTPTDSTDGGWFRTGDLAASTRRLAHHRRADQGRHHPRRREHLAPPRSSAMLEAHPAVRQAVAVGLPDDRLGERVAAFVVAAAAVRRRRRAALVRGRGRRPVQDARAGRRRRRAAHDAAGKPDRAAIRTRAASFSEG